MKGKCDNKEGDLDSTHPFPLSLRILHQRGSDMKGVDVTEVSVYYSNCLIREAYQNILPLHPFIFGAFLGQMARNATKCMNR